MKFKIKTLLLGTSVFILLNAVAVYFGRLSFDKDHHAASAKIFLLNDPELSGEVGPIESATAVQRIIYEGGSNDKAYRSYTFDVKGSKRRAWLDVRIYPGIGESPDNIIIHDIDFQ